jgi:hypothetical protein
MSLWGAVDSASGNQKPIFANSNNKNMLASTVYGVSAAERANVTGATLGLAHAGWNIIKKGTGGIASITISSAGSGINANGFLVLSEVVGANTLNSNIAYTASSNANSTLNVITAVTITNPGRGYESAPTVVYNGANTTRPTFVVTMGGRVGRITSETLVATGSISGDNSGDDTILPGT